MSTTLCYVILHMRLTTVLCQDVAKKTKFKGPFSINCRERGSDARGVYPTQDTLRMGTARVKQEEEADTGVIVKDE